MPSNRPKIIAIVDEDLKHDVERLAASQQRTVSNFVATLLAKLVASERAKSNPNLKEHA